MKPLERATVTALDYQNVTAGNGEQDLNYYRHTPWWDRNLTIMRLALGAALDVPELKARLYQFGALAQCSNTVCEPDGQPCEHMAAELTELAQNIRDYILGE